MKRCVRIVTSGKNSPLPTLLGKRRDGFYCIKREFDQIVLESILRLLLLIQKSKNCIAFDAAEIPTTNIRKHNN